MPDTEKPALTPTPTRLRMARVIAAGEVRHYPFFAPETICQTTGDICTARVRRLVDAGLVALGEATEHNYSIVSLTPAGEEWLAKHGSALNTTREQ